jgi:hypothetical protein
MRTLRGPPPGPHRMRTTTGWLRSKYVRPIRRAVAQPERQMSSDRGARICTGDILSHRPFGELASGRARWREVASLHGFSPRGRRLVGFPPRARFEAFVRNGPQECRPGIANRTHESRGATPFPEGRPAY